MCAQTHRPVQLTGSPQSKRRVWFGAFAITLGVAVLTGCASTTIRPQTSSPQTAGPTRISSAFSEASLASLCIQAKNLIVNDQPQQALDLIESIRAGAPELEAVLEPTAAPTAAPTATPTATATATPTPTATATATADALACIEGARLTALSQISTEDSQQSTTRTWPATLGTAWDKATAAWVLPLVPPGLAVLGILVALVLIARLARVIPQISFRNVLPHTAISATLAGVVGIVVGTMLMVGSIGTPSLGIWQLALTLLSATIALASTVLLARGLASRLRIDIQVVDNGGEPNSAGTGLLVGYLSDLGKRPPTGMEMPIGTDVSIFTDASLTSTPDQNVIAFLYKIVQFAVGDTPWKATVDTTDNDNLVVQISRNGRSVNSHVIRRGDFDSLASVGASAENAAQPAASVAGPTVTRPDLKKLAAGAILTTLAQYYRGFEGLCDATEWRSVGLHYIATSDFDRMDPVAVPILAAALEYDPRNRLARLTFRHCQFRYSQNDNDLERYTWWLRHEFADVISSEAELHGTPPDGESPYLDYKRRLLYNYVIAVLNLRTLPDQATAEAQFASLLAREFEALLNVAVRPPDPLPERMRATCAAALKAFAADPTTPQAQAQTQGIEDVGARDLLMYRPSEAYNAACTLTTAAEGMTDTAIRDVVHTSSLNLLRYAVLIPTLKEWAPRDPSLQPLLADPEFGSLFGWSPRESFWEMEPFTELRDKLERLGVAEPARLHAVSTVRPNTRLLLGLNPTKFERLQRLSKLAHLSEQVASTATGRTDYSLFKVELVASLIALGFETAGETKTQALAVALRESLLARNHRAPDLPDIERWLVHMQAY